jgi:quaternary ammonium compound-resistance protein SugE
VFGDPNIPIRWLGAALILLGVILLKVGWCRWPTLKI